MNNAWYPYVSQAGKTIRCMFAYHHLLSTPSNVLTQHITGVGHAREWQAGGQAQADNGDKVQFRLGNTIVWVIVEELTTLQKLI